jgi:hypothetical protein
MRRIGFRYAPSNRSGLRQCLVSLHQFLGVFVAAGLQLHSVPWSRMELVQPSLRQQRRRRTCKVGVDGFRSVCRGVQGALKKLSGGISMRRVEFEFWRDMFIAVGVSIRSVCSHAFLIRLPVYNRRRNYQPSRKSSLKSSNFSKKKTPLHVIR